MDSIDILNFGQYILKHAEHSTDVFWIRDTNYERQLYISPVFEKIWGVSCKSLYQNPNSWFEAIHAEDLLRVREDINRIRKSCKVGDSYSHEYRIIRDDKEQRWILDYGFPIFDVNNKLIGYAGVAKDITDEKLRLAELEKAPYFFRIFAEKIQQSVFWARDPNCEKQIYISPSYEKIWGNSCESLYEDPSSWIQTLVEEDQELYSAKMRLQLLEKNGTNVKYEDRYRIGNKEGKIIWIKDTSFPIFDDQNNLIGFAGIAEDITKHVLHEQELREAKQRAEVANQAKSDFLAMVSHELRTPLNAILGMAQILHTQGLSPILKEYVDIITNAGNNLLALVNDVLDFVKLEAGKLSFLQQPFNLKDLITQIIQSMQYQANEKGLFLSSTYPNELSKLVIGDQNRVRQILVNLLSNSIKFTEQGHINVSVKCIEKSKRKALFEIAVTDTGVGIRKDKLEYIFEKFSQLYSVYYRKHKGLGLGLTITKELVEKMGGKIEVTSEFGKGSQFRVALPLQLWDINNNKIGKNIHASHLKIPKPQYNLKVLLVEDNIVNQKIAKIMLEEFGCQVDIASNGQEVLERFDTLNDYALIFMDIGLPDISGFDIVTRLRQEPHLKKIPIVAMTAHILERDREQAYHSGMNKIVAKPINYSEIAAVLETYKGQNRSST